MQRVILTVHRVILTVQRVTQKREEWVREDQANFLACHTLFAYGVILYSFDDRQQRRWEVICKMDQVYYIQYMK